MRVPGATRSGADRDPVDGVVNELREGRFVVIGDGKREAGYLLLAAESADRERINHMVVEAGGLICLALPAQRCAELGLELIPTRDEPLHGKDFTVSIESCEGISTGISAADRARTIRIAADPASSMSDLCRPGHVFPLRARGGGLLARPAIAEAAIDLAMMANLTPAVVIADVLDEEGTHVAAGEELAAFARRNALPMATIDQLVARREDESKTSSDQTRCLA